MPFARINDVVLHYRLSGDPSRQKVIAFANSLGTDFRIWDDLVTAFSGDYACLQYDKRGHGLSDAPPPPYVMTDHIGDLEGLLDHLGIEDVIVCGDSVGGMIAQGLAGARPDQVQGLVLCDTGHKIGAEALWNDRIRAVETRGIAAIAEAILERWFSEDYRQPDNAAFAGYRNMLIRTTIEGYAGTCAALRDADLTEVARRIACPALCIVGEHDGSTPPALVKAMADLIPGARYHEIAGAGHLPCIEQPEALVAVMRAFLADNGLSGTS